MSTKMWGGRFGEGTGALMEAYSESMSYDRRMYRQDIAGSKAHARMLAKRGVLSGEEAERIVAGLELALDEIESGVFPWRQELEDVHMDFGILGEGQINLADRAKGPSVENLHVEAALAGGGHPTFHGDIILESFQQGLGAALARKGFGQDDLVPADGHDVQGDGIAFVYGQCAVFVEKFGFVGYAIKFCAGVHHKRGFGDGNDGSSNAVSNADLAAAFGQGGLHERSEFALGRHIFVVRRLICHDRSESGG